MWRECAGRRGHRPLWTVAIAFSVQLRSIWPVLAIWSLSHGVWRVSGQTGSSIMNNNGAELKTSAPFPATGTGTGLLLGPPRAGVLCVRCSCTLRCHNNNNK